MQASIFSPSQRRLRESEDARSLRQLIADAVQISRSVDRALHRRLCQLMRVDHREKPNATGWKSDRSSALLTCLRMFIYVHREAKIIDDLDISRVELCIGHIVEFLQIFDLGRAQRIH